MPNFAKASARANSSARQDEIRGRQQSVLPQGSIDVAQIIENLVEREVNSVSDLSTTGAKQTLIFTREFDPGSESTLAARLTHASRTRKWSNP